MAWLIAEFFDTLGPTGVAAVSGVVVQVLTSIAKATILKDAWARWGWLARVFVVALVSAAVAGLSGWVGGMTGVALATHIASTFFVALGWRQVIKRLLRQLWNPPPPPPYIPGGGRSIRTNPPRVAV